MIGVQGSMRDRVRRLLVAGVLWAALAPAGATANGWTSDGEVGRFVLHELLAPIEEAARPLESRLIALRVVDSQGTDRGLEALTEEIGNFFWDAGYEVQIVSSGVEVEPEAWTLDLRVRAAVVDTPRRRGAFLGLGDGQILRRVKLEFSGRLEDPATGRWYWKGAPSRSVERWVDASGGEELASDRPQWAESVASPMPPNGAKWWERSLVAGLLAGVVTLYFSGAN